MWPAIFFYYSRCAIWMSCKKKTVGFLIFEIVFRSRKIQNNKNTFNRLVQFNVAKTIIMYIFLWRFYFHMNRSLPSCLVHWLLFSIVQFNWMRPSKTNKMFFFVQWGNLHLYFLYRVFMNPLRMCRGAIFFFLLLLLFSALHSFCRNKLLIHILLKKRKKKENLWGKYVDCQ